MSTTHAPRAGQLPIDPYPWRHLPANLALVAASWAALLAWLFGGSEGAGNLFMAWTWFLALVFTCSAMATPVRLMRPAPSFFNFFFRVSALGQMLILAWFGCWWLFAASTWAMAMSLAWRHDVNKRIAAQTVQAERQEVA